MYLERGGRLICVHVGDKKDLGTLEVQHLLDEAWSYRYIGDCLTARDYAHAHREPSSLSEYLIPV